MPIYFLANKMFDYTTDIPIYALATARAPSALAVTRTSGKNSITLLSKAFSSPGRLIAAADKSLLHGYLRDDDGSDIDEVVLAVYREGSGYTGEEAVEISTHGSLAVIDRLSRRLEELGFRPASKGEFTFRAFMHGRMDLTQAEAVEEIVNSKCESAQERALGRLEGRLRGRLESIRASLLDILASIEVQLDYAEDEILEDWVFPDGEISSICAELRRLVESYSASRIQRDGAKVVLAGPANAGKSSLFNHLVKEERAIVSPVAGTTRDYIEAWIDLSGLPVHLYDTAGLRESGDEVEGEGMRRSRALMEDADLVVYLTDPDNPDVPADLDTDRTLVVFSKSDIEHRATSLSFSSVTGEGIGELVNAIRQRIGSVPLPGDDMVIDSRRQKEGLERCLACLEAARSNRGQSADIMALFFQGALEELALLTGEVTNEELLDTLFSKFCLGK